MIQRYNFLSGFTILILSALLGATIICHFERSPKGVVEKSHFIGILPPDGAISRKLGSPLASLGRNDKKESAEGGRKETAGRGLK